MAKRKRRAEEAETHQDPGLARDYSKRKRVSRACDQCRSSREKCNGSSPCQTCASQNRECSFEEPARKRGIQPKYIRALEVSLAWLFKTIPEDESVLLTGLTQGGGLGGLVYGSDTDAANELQHAFKDSSISQRIDQLLSGEPPTSNGRVDPSRDRVARASVVAPQSSSTTSSTVESNPTDRYRSTALNLEAMGEKTQQFIELPDDVWKLLEYYFAFTHSWLPVIEKATMLKLIYDYPKEGLAAVAIADAEHAELWSILALSSFQLSDENSKHRARQIRDIAENLIPTTTSNTPYQVSHMNAMLLLALLDLSEDRILSAWLRIGPVVSLLLLFPLLQKLGQNTAKCKELHLAAFIVEQALAAHLRVPTHSRAVFIEAMGFLEEDGLEEWSPWHDPLDDSHGIDGRRPPTRANSTLNELVRTALRSSDQSTTTTQAEGSSDISVVSSLLKNAILGYRNRVQPHLLVTRHGHESGRAETIGNG